MVLHRESVLVDALTEISAVWAVPADFQPGATDTVVIAHGAGSDMDSDFMCHVHEGLAEAGVLGVKFNFPYKQQGRRAPDRAPRLEAAYRAVVEQVRRHAAYRPGRLFIGGKSMGGRIASHLAAAGEPVAGLVFLGYPLHPAGQPERLRAAHLPGIACPMLFVQGSRDRLCDLARLRGALAPVAGQCTLHVIDDGDHSFAVPARARRSREEVWAEINAAVSHWLRRVPR